MADSPSNLSAVLQLIWHELEISRAEVARRLDLSRSTVSSLVQQLLDIDAVQEARIGRSRGGRPPVMLRFAAEGFRMIGVDLGATHIGVVVMDALGHRLGGAHREHSVESDPTGTIVAIHGLIEAALSGAKAHGGRVIGIGVGVPSPVHSWAPGQLSPSILPAWKDVRLAELISERWLVPTYLENDANLGALGELVWGAGRGVVDLAFVKLATGVGSGLIVNGELYRGAEGIAGEIGHTAIDAGGPLCRCGLSGCLETLIGSKALEARFAAERKHWTGPTDLGDTVDLATLARAAADGDALAVQVIGTAGRQLGSALANLVNIVNPSRIVLGGRLALAGEALLVPVREAIAARAMWTNVAAADVVSSSLGDDAVPLGAATLVLRTALAEPLRFAHGLPHFIPSRTTARGGPTHPTP